MLLYIFASNGLTIQGWCWGLAWAMLGLRFFFALVKALVDMVQKDLTK